MNSPNKFNITYLFGAGASAMAVPTVTQFKGALIEFDHIVESRLSQLEARETSETKGATGKFRKNLKRMLSAIDKYGTLDTYARMLFLQDRDQELSDLKLALGIIFVMWQEWPGRHIFEDQVVVNQGQMMQKDFQDQRYVGLLANLLSKGDNKIVLPSNFKFLTWNYDLQFEAGLQLFSGSQDFQQTFEQYKIYPAVKGNKLVTPFNMIHLNGIAGAFDIASNGGINSLYERIKGKKEFVDAFAALMFVFNSVEIDKININERMTFAWEENSISKKAIEEAIEIMRATNVLIVVGYSFPGFNLDVDRKLMEALKVERKEHMRVIYQDLDPNVELIRDSFGIDMGSITAHKNINQFLIPRQYL
ncbi:MAG TPA: hypothetical protein PLU73_05760 [Bacteroidia bacterium]|nr:hypothetical protein [Bacteroidia bacterium]